MTSEQTALRLLDQGFWPVVLYAPGEIRDVDGEEEPAKGKEPIGLGWGKSRPRPSDLRNRFRGHPGRGVGLKLGPGGGVIDLEVDGPEGEDSLRRLCGGTVPETIGWSSRRGPHRLFGWDDRLSAVDRIKVELDGFPGLEIRCGQDDRQSQSACPPTVGEDGVPRRWNGVANLANLPECAIMAILEGIRPKTRPQPRTSRNGHVPSSDVMSSYAQKAMEGELAAVTGAAEGERNATLNLAAHALGTLVGAGALDRSEAEAALEDAATRTGLGIGEIRRTIRSGIDAGQKKPRDLSGVGQSSNGAYDAFDARRTAQKGSIPGSDWPKPPGEPAFAGLVGEVVNLIKPATEADPVGLLLQLLIGVGSILGHDAWVMAEGARHHGNLFGLTVGASSRSRKGTAWRRVRPFLEAADPDWARDRIAGGLSTGEGLLSEVRDSVMNPDGTVKVEGVSDKRLMVMEGEFGKVLRVMKRNDSTLSAIMRLAFDGDEPLRIMTKVAPLRSTGHHISIAGHITGEELLTYLDHVEIFNGLGNRILVACVRRSTPLPRGGTIDELKVGSLAMKISERLAAARAIGCFGRTDAFWKRWDDDGVYLRLTEERAGLWGVLTSRSEALVLRLAFLYAVLDGKRMIDVGHLESALAFWKYCDDSVAHLFGKWTIDPKANKLLKALRASETGLTRDAIHRAVFQGHETKEAIERFLALLLKQELAYPRTTQTDGRPAETWWPGTPS